MTRRTSPDDEVVARAREGDEAAWRDLYAGCGDRLITWLRSQPHLDAAMSAEDLANEAWFVAAKKLGDFKGSTDDFYAWLFGIARHLSLNDQRRSQRRNTRPIDVDPRELLSQPGYDGEVDRVDQLAWTRALLNRLAPREAETVACLDVIGLDIAATAKALGISATAVRVAHHRAIRRLRDIVDSPVESELPLTIFTG